MNHKELLRDHGDEGSRIEFLVHTNLNPKREGPNDSGST